MAQLIIKLEYSTEVDNVVLENFQGKIPAIRERFNFDNVDYLVLEVKTNIVKKETQRIVDFSKIKNEKFSDKIPVSAYSDSPPLYIAESYILTVRAI